MAVLAWKVGGLVYLWKNVLCHFISEKRLKNYQNFIWKNIEAEMFNYFKLDWEKGLKIIKILNQKIDTQMVLF